MNIIVDDRERAIINFLEQYSEQFHIPYEVKRLEVGDYAITYKGFILIIIERKTWEDLSSSMRDGRKDNVKKLLNLRDNTQCTTCYLIEGDPCPKPGKMFSRLPYKNLRSHLDHLMFRDNIHIQHTRTAEDTAYRLFELAQNYLTIKNNKIKEIDNCIPDNPTNPISNLPKKKGTRKNIQTTEELVNSIEHAINNTDDHDQITTNINFLTERHVKDPNDISYQVQLLQCLPSVGSVVSVLLAENGITLYSIYHEQHSIENIANIKYPTGSIIGIDRATKIVNSKKYFDNYSRLSHTIKVRVLSSIPLISKQTAEIILANISFDRLFDNDENLSDLISLEKSEKSKIGTKAVENIITILRQK